MLTFTSDLKPDKIAHHIIHLLDVHLAFKEVVSGHRVIF